MKLMRIFMILAIALVAVGMVSGSVSAQKFSYTSGINVQNLGGASATIVITYYGAGNSDGTGGAVVTTANDTIAAGGVKNYFPIHTTGSFNGSIVISSDQPLAAVTNITNTNLTSLGAYNGTSAGSTTVFLPILHKGNSGWDSWYSVQNAGSANATVQIDYSSNGAGVDKSITIAPGASVSVAQKDETIHGSTKFFAATLTSTQPIVVVALQENASNIMAYTGFSAGSTAPILPIINMNNAGYFTGTQIYNLGSSPTNVTVTYTPGIAGAACTETQTIPAKAMVVFTTSAFTNTVAGETCANGARFVGSAKVTTNSASQSLAVVVNQLRAPSNINGSSYSAFDPALATSSVNMPTIMERNAGWYTAFNLVNAGTGTAFVKCTYANSAVTYTTGAGGLAAGSSVTVSQQNAIADKYVGSSNCKTYTNNSYTTVDPAGKIFSIVNELGTGSPDNLLTYEGINN
jgi:hypothetical protein